ncbi:hypothetical protein [Caldicellulosiruptor acetigenus]|nr:hypothetical protein [Caldicellulosiruptor acetigenus]
MHFKILSQGGYFLFLLWIFLLTMVISFIQQPLSLLIVFFLPVKLPWKENHKLLIFILAISTSLWILSLILGRIESESAKKLCVLFLNIVAFTASIMYVLAFFVLAYFLYPFLFRAVIKIFSWGAHSVERFLIICIILVLIAGVIKEKDEGDYFDSDYL